MFKAERELEKEAGIVERELIIGDKALRFSTSEQNGRLAVTVGDSTLDVRFIPLPDGRKLCLVNGKVVEWGKSGNPGIRYVRFEGSLRQIKVVNPRKLRSAGAGEGADGTRAEIKAPMPGKVVKLLVKEGELVAAEQGIVVLEAMKMENELRTPVSGIVSRLDVGIGSTVEMGFLVAVVEPQSPSA